MSGLLLSVRNCHASMKMETELTLLLFFCAPHARIKIMTSSKFRAEKIFTFSHLEVLCEICKILHRSKISLYTVFRPAF